MKFRYFETDDGRRFAYATKPTFSCRLADLDLPSAQREQATAAALETAAAALGCQPDRLVAMLTLIHRRYGAGGRKRTASGALTGDCAACGARLVRHGFRVWVDEPVTDVDGVRAADAAISWGLDGVTRRTLRDTFLETRATARAWAREEFRIHEAALAEQRP